MAHFIFFSVTLNVKMNYARNYKNLLNFVKVMPKILVVPFFPDTVYKDDTAPDIFRSMFYEICASYDNFDRIYTDGSKIGDRVPSAAICSNMVRSTRLPNNVLCEHRAELYAITLAMYFVRRSRDSNFVIFSDSMSSLEALNRFKLELDLLQKITMANELMENVALVC